MSMCFCNSDKIYLLLLLLIFTIKLDSHKNFLWIVFKNMRHFMFLGTLLFHVSISTSLTGSALSENPDQINSLSQFLFYFVTTCDNIYF